MSHGISKYDVVFSVKSPEWHGLARVVESIGAPEIAVANFPIVEQTLDCRLGDVVIPMPDYKVLIADLRHREDLAVADQLVPLNIPKQGYTPISNLELYNQAVELCNAAGFMSITTMGTLEGCRKFFISLDTGDSELKVKNHASGQVETVLSHINLINSHDSSLAGMIYDSMVRIVCMNTLRWSLASKGEAGGKVYHTRNAKLALDALVARIKDIIQGRTEYVHVMERLAETTVSREKGLNIVLAYLATDPASGDQANKISARGFNTAEAIMDLYKNGKGNVGKSMYDLLQGATDYWTNGDGTGKKTDRAAKVFKSEFGGAADHKNRFLDFIESRDLENENEVGEALRVSYLKSKED